LILREEKEIPTNGSLSEPLFSRINTVGSRIEQRTAELKAMNNVEKGMKEGALCIAHH